MRSTWHEAGHRVPAGYDSSDVFFEYQLQKGPGDGRRPPSVIPVSLQRAGGAAAALPVVPSAEPSPRFDALVAARLLSLTALTARGVMLLFVTTIVQPLIYAPLSGLEVTGAELPISVSPKSTTMHAMESWASAAWGAAAPATTCMVGRYLSGPRVGVAVLPFVPPARDVARSAGA